MLVRKHIAGPGRFWYVNRDTGMPACLDATPERIRKWHDNGNAMLAAGLSIPVPVEHKEANEPGAGPMPRSAIAAAELKNNAGWAHKFEMEGDQLFSVLDIQDESLIPNLPKTIRYTSPWIASFMDGSGKQWDEAPLHIALTTRPRITKQQPFSTVSAAMSYALNATVPALPKSGVCLSCAGLLTKRGEVFQPVNPMAFSLWSGGIMLSEDEMPKKEEKKAGGKPPDMGPDGQPVPESLVDEAGDISVETVIADLLSIIGINMPDSCTPENFRECLYHALMDKHKSDSGMTEPDPMADPMTPEHTPNQPPAVPKKPVVEETQPMYMSIEAMKKEVAKVSDPVTQALCGAMLSMHEQNIALSESLKKNVLDVAASKRKTRIDALVKATGDPEVEKELTELATSTGAQLSIGADGQVKDTFDTVLTAYEKRIAKMPTIPAVLKEIMKLPGAGVQFAVQDHPLDTDAQFGVNGSQQMTAERAKELADAQLKKHGHM